MNETNQDEEHLRLLAIFHQVVGGLCCLFALFPLLYFMLGLFMMSGGSHPERAGEFGPLFAGCFMAGLGGLFLAMATAFAVALFLAGRYLRERRRHTFCVVVAAVSCAFSPFGTVLGIFTLIVLFRPSVQALFDVPVAAPTVSPDSPSVG